MALSLKEQLKKKTEELHGDDKVFGMVALTNPGYISSSRSIMLTLHLKQYVNLNKPEFPKVYTNFENLVGEHSTNYKRVDRDYRVVRKIHKFIDKPGHLYSLILHDDENDYYDLIDKKLIEDLTEKFGFSYNTSKMDSFNENDVIPKNEVLYKSLSYDDDMNYSYGLNATVMYAIHNHTIEDAAVCSESFAKRMMSKETETVTVTLNDNDIFCNIYGDKDNYKCFPDIGETIKNEVLCAKRRIHNNQILYDLKRDNLCKINVTSDTPYYCDGNIVDIMIYCNKDIEELEDNNFNRQLKTYIINQNNYYKEVYDVTKEIIDSGADCSDYLKYIHRRAKEITDPDYKWRPEDGRPFSHIVMKFVVERDVPLMIGSKITGLSGDKSVVSKIVPDDEMPYIYEKGKKKSVELILNTLGVINRLNSWQLYQVSINYIMNKVSERIMYIKSTKEKEKLLFDMIGRFNLEQMRLLSVYYDELNKEEKKDFWRSVVEDGIYIHIPPLWEDESNFLFDKINNVYKSYDWIHPDDVFVHKFGREIKIFKKLIVAEKYILKMKQTSKKGFSVRSTSSINKQGLPSKSSKAKNNLELWSKTPIRMGIDENINTCIAAPSEIIAKLHLFYRNSTIGRKELSKVLNTTLKPLNDFKYSDDFSNRNVEILKAYFKCLGYKLIFSDEVHVIDVDDGKVEMFETTDDRLFLGNKHRYGKYEEKNHIRTKLRKKMFLSTIDEIEKEVEEELKRLNAEKDKKE